MVKKVKRTKTLPFGRLLEGVVAVLSGFQNPLRGQLRDRLLAMGRIVQYNDKGHL